MGGGLSISEQRVLEGDGSALSQFVGLRALPATHTFWSDGGALNTMRFSLHDLEPEELTNVVAKMCTRLVQNNMQTRNLNVLLALLCERIGAALARPNEQVHPSTVNIVFIARIFLNHFIETLSSEQLREHLVPECALAHDRVVAVSIVPIDSDSASHLPLPSRLLSVILDASIRIVINKTNYHFHLELLNLFLVLISTQIYADSVHTSPASHIFVEAWQQRGATHTQALTERLLHHFTRRVPHASFSPLISPKANQPSSWWSSMKTNVLSVLLWPFQIYRMFFASHIGHPLSDVSALLLLVLVYQPPNDIFSMQQSLANIADDDLDFINDKPPHRISFTLLYEAFCHSADEEWSLVLLFSVININRNFCDVVYSKADVDLLILPLLRMLYREQNLASNKVYVLLVTLLLLTQDDAFSNHAHRRLDVHSVPWFKEQFLRDISLGSLIMAVLLRTMTRNLVGGRPDEYLHTNCLASISNMAPHTTRLHEYTAQRLISMLAGLSRRYTRLSRRIALDDPDRGLMGSIRSHSDDSSSHDIQNFSIDDQDLDCDDEFSIDEMASHGEFIRLLLHVISACLEARNLPENISLLYALLHDQRVLDPFTISSAFIDVLPYIQGVVDHFSVLLPEDGSVASIRFVLRQAARSFDASSSQIIAAPASHPKFLYENVSDAEDFFLPYAWQLACSTSVSLSWCRERTELFVPDERNQDEVDSIDEEEIQTSDVVNDHELTTQVDVDDNDAEPAEGDDLV